MGVQTAWIRSSAFFRNAAVLVAIGVFLVVFNPFARLDPSALPPNVSPSHPLVITVQPGDTLWSIAQRVEPGKDPRPLVDLLNSATGGKPIDPGQQIVLK
ncbi:MAG: LysM peptidoglycan-binding domain-containing protein [Acidimicrobiales bacterium]|nr:LysM peptidoglycan-binding domain-containing protein [Acidimicrobiales bacterium]